MSLNSPLLQKVFSGNMKCQEKESIHPIALSLTLAEVPLFVLEIRV